MNLRAEGRSAGRALILDQAPWSRNGGMARRPRGAL